MTEIHASFSSALQRRRTNVIGHGMSIRNLILGVNSVTVSYFIHYDRLFQNATAILLQNATEVYSKMRHVFYYKMQQIYYKIQQ